MDWGEEWKRRPDMAVAESRHPVRGGDRRDLLRSSEGADRHHRRRHGDTRVAAHATSGQALRLLAYFTDEGVRLKTRTCRVKAWAHDNGFSLVTLTAINSVGWFLTVWQCH